MSVGNSLGVWRTRAQIEYGAEPPLFMYCESEPKRFFTQHSNLTASSLQGRIAIKAFSFWIFSKIKKVERGNTLSNKKTIFSTLSLLFHEKKEKRKKIHMGNFAYFCIISFKIFSILIMNG